MAQTYRILVSASARRPKASLYAFDLPTPIPAFPLPLAMGDPEPVINLQALLGEIYDQSGYDLAINYQLDPSPPLSPEVTQWLETWLQH